MLRAKPDSTFCPNPSTCPSSLRSCATALKKPPLSQGEREKAAIESKLLISISSGRHEFHELTRIFPRWVTEIARFLIRGNSLKTALQYRRYFILFIEVANTKFAIYE